MIHFSCDRCGRPIDQENELRYVVRIEVEAVMAPLEGVIEDDERDYLMEISEILEQGDAAKDPLIGDEVFDRKRYDLCSECKQRFIKSPVGETKSKHLNFSTN